MSKLKIKTDGSSGGVKMLKQGFNVAPPIQKAGRMHLHYDA